MPRIETPHIRAPDEVRLRRRPLRPVPHHSHKTRGSRRPSPRGRRSTSTRMSVPTTMGRGPRLPRPPRFWTFGRILAHARTRTFPCPASSQAYSAEGSGPRCSDHRRTSHLRPVARRASDVRWRIAGARIAVEATPGARTDEDLARRGLPSGARRDLTGSRSPHRRRTGGRPLLLQADPAKPRPARRRSRRRLGQAGRALHPRGRSSSRRRS